MEQYVGSRLDRAIGLKIRWARRALMMRQEDLALAVQIEEDQVVRFEQGAEVISSGTLVKLSKALRKPIIWFFEDIAETMGEPHLSLVNTDLEECLRYLALLRDKNALHIARDVLQVTTETLD